jgi:hypothetical protein
MEPRQEEQDRTQEQAREPQPGPRKSRFHIEPLEERIAPGINRLGTD